MKNEIWSDLLLVWGVECALHSSWSTTFFLVFLFQKWKEYCKKVNHPVLFESFHDMVNTKCVEEEICLCVWCHLKKFRGFLHTCVWSVIKCCTLDTPKTLSKTLFLLPYTSHQHITPWLMYQLFLLLLFSLQGMWGRESPTVQ